jgi:16S rRNA (cytosine967-C5)-methyltransferase
MGDRGKVVAFDIHPHKIRLIEENCRRLGITCVSPEAADARKMPGDYAGRADYALLDAPCTGTGVIRRRPDARWKKNPAQLPEILALQGEMLASVARCVKPGGVLVYSTCSVLAEENRGQVEAFLKNTGEYRLESLAELMPGSLAGEASVPEGFIQLYPHRHGTDGFFMARMRRRA